MKDNIFKNKQSSKMKGYCFQNIIFDSNIYEFEQTA